MQSRFVPWGRSSVRHCCKIADSRCMSPEQCAWIAGMALSACSSGCAMWRLPLYRKESALHFRIGHQFRHAALPTDLPFLQQINPIRNDLGEMQILLGKED